MIDLTSVLDADGQDETETKSIFIKRTKNTCAVSEIRFFSVDKNYDELRKTYCATFETFLKESANDIALFC